MSKELKTNPVHSAPTTTALQTYLNKILTRSISRKGVL